MSLPVPAPMLATLGPLPSDEDAWAYEISWHGIRAPGIPRFERLQRRVNVTDIRKTIALAREFRSCSSSSTRSGSTADRCCNSQERGLGFATYRAALEREEYAARIHSNLTERLGAPAK
jgi:hypothetical protein